MSSSFKPVVEAAQDGLRGNPDSAMATFSVTSRQVEGLRSEVSARSFNLTIDEPRELGGSDLGPNPAEVALAALAACQEITYRLYADTMEIPLRDVSVTVSGDIDLRGLFGVDDTIRPGYEKISVDINLVSDAPAADIERLKKAVNDHCPILDLLKNKTPVQTNISGSGKAVAAE